MSELAEKLEGEINSINVKLRREYESTLLQECVPIVKRVETKLSEYMASLGIKRVFLRSSSFDGPDSSFTFMNDGYMHVKQGNTKHFFSDKDLGKMVELYKDASEYSQGCADPRIITRPDTSQALKDFIGNLGWKLEELAAKKLQSELR